MFDGFGKIVSGGAVSTAGAVVVSALVYSPVAGLPYNTYAKGAIMGAVAMGGAMVGMYILSMTTRQ